MGLTSPLKAAARSSYSGDRVNLLSTSPSVRWRFSKGRPSRPKRSWKRISKSSRTSPTWTGYHRPKTRHEWGTRTRAESGNSVRSIPLRPGCPGDLPSVALRVGEVPRVTAPLTLDRTGDRPSPGRQSRTERLVDSLGALDIDPNGDPVPRPLGHRFPRSRFLAELPKGMQGKEHASGLVGSEVVARTGPLLPAQLGIEGSESRHISYPEGDVADPLRKGHLVNSARQFGRPGCADTGRGLGYPTTPAQSALSVIRAQRLSQSANRP